MEVENIRKDREYRGFKDLKVYQLSFQLSLELFEVGKMLSSMINQPEKFCY